MTNASKRFLFVVTSHDQLGETGDKTGFHFSEMAEPYLILTRAGVAVDIASIKGGKAPADPSSIEDPDDREAAIINEFNNTPGAKEKIENTTPIEDIRLDDYDGIYLPGGHGTMWDFPDNKDLVALIETAWAQGKIIAAVCHGPAALVHPRNGDGEPIIKGMTVNSFTDEEERKAGKDKVVPFLLESKLKEQGAKFKKEGPFQSCVAQDGQLITGQNPASAAPLAEAILGKLGVKSKPMTQAAE